MRGRHPTPTPILAARGSPRAKSRPNEPRPEIAAPTAPKYLGELARLEWRRVVPLLLTMRVLSKSDRGVLAMYATAYGRWVEAERQLATDGIVVKSPNGYPIQNPFLAVANKAMEQTHRFAVELGLTPVARGRLHVAPEAPATKFPRLSGFDRPELKIRRRAIA
jgi:P27 family predicted phage terminase small subunit